MAEQEFEKLLQIIKELQSQLKLAQDTMGNFKKQFSKTGAEEFNQLLAHQRLEAERLTKELERLQRAYNNLKTPTNVGTVGQPNVIPTPQGQKIPKNIDEVVAAVRKGAEFDSRQNDVDRKLNSAKQKQLSEEEIRIQVIRESVRADRRFAKALEYAAEKGFDLSNLRGVYSRGTGINKLQFRKYNDLGIRQDLDLFTNPNGRVTPGISNQFRTFGQGVVRDIQEFTKWSIALAAVYGPMRKLQELTQTMIENQTKLAQATIVVNSSIADSSDIFDLAAKAAQASGEEITGVIDAFTLAYRATGGARDEVERMATATKLLSDSLLLSKLSTLDQAQAIDVLSASIRQTGGDFSTSTQLLDSWVRVTKVANVDLTTLATGFAVLGDAADAANISTDELNGIIAALAESTQSSSKEVANQARALVSGFQSDNARKELENLGIAVTNVTGEMRPFLDIMQELYNLRQTKIIDNTQFSRLTLALGGGTRRQSVYTTFIENFDRVFAVAKESEKASGDAEAALAKQLETVQTGLTRLSNAFEELAQTLGTEGGLLGIFTDMISGLTGLVKLFDGLVSILGKATPAMAAFIATSTILKSKGIPGLQTGIGNIIGERKVSIEPIRSQLYDEPYARQINAVRKNILGTNALSGVFQGAALSAIPALLNFTNKEDRFGKTKAGADIIGGVAGGVIGSLVAGSPLVGAAIGTAIAEAFVNTTIDRKTDLFGYGKPTTVGEPTPFTEKLQKNPLDALKEAEQGLYKSIGFGSEGLGRFITSATAKEVPKVVGELNKLILEGDREALDKYLGQGIGNKTRGAALQAQGISLEQIYSAFATKAPIQATPERPAYLRASEEARQNYDKALAAYAAEKGQTENLTTPFSDLVAQNREAYQQIVNQIRETTKEGISQQRVQGNLKGTEYTTQISSLTGYDVKALQYYTALGDEFININKDVNTAADAFEAFALITTKGSQESVTEITSIVSEIEKLINLLDDPKLNEEALGAFGGLEEAKKRLEELKQTGASLLADTYNQARISQINVPNIQGDRQKPLQKNEFTQVLQLAGKYQEEFYRGFLKIPDELYTTMKKGFDEWAQIVADSGDEFYTKVSEIDPQFFQQALQKLIEEGKVKSQEGFGLQRFDIDRLTLERLAAQSITQGNAWAQQFPGFETKQEDLLAITNDNIAKPIHADFRILALLLEKIIDQNQKQLDGQYNIPEGATFWVPLTAAYYRPKTEGTGGLGGLDTSGLDTSAQNLDGSAQALNDAADYIVQAFAKDEDFNAELLKQLRGTPASTQSTEDKIRSALVNRYRGANETGAQTTESAYRSYLVGEKDYNPYALKESADSRPRESVLDYAGITSAIEALKSVFESLQNSFSTLVPQSSGEDVNKSLNAKLEFQVDNTTNLMVDGRVLASVITPYLASDLLRIEASQGTITKRYII